MMSKEQIHQMILDSYSAELDMDEQGASEWRSAGL